MKLTDIKKLKVAELRSRLKDLGLDSKGLKAELVGRLWSAVEATQAGEDGKEEIKLQTDPATTPPEPAETVEEDRAPAPSPRTDAGVTARSKVDPNTREFTDSATQTETGADLATQESRFTTGGVQEERELHIQQEDAEDPGEDRRAEMGRGRAFYEFKEEIRYKRAKSPQPPADGDEAEADDDDKVRLNPFDSHLHFEVGPDGACGQPRFWARFPSLWSGCRLTHGVQQGRVGFEVRLEKKLSTTQEDLDPHGLRVGWSMSSSSLLLGADEFSFAYDSQGKKVSGGTEEEFGESFSEGDIIACYASFSSDGAVELSFHKNGRFMGTAFSPRTSGRALYPHVLCKSCSVRFHLDPTAPPWYPGPAGFTSLVALPAGQMVCATSAPTSRAQCEVVLMVGLPGSGKSHWARAHMKQHPEKQFRLLSSEELLSCVMSGGQRDSRLQQASQCLTDLIKLAAQTPANYILDQCNILFSARRHKLQLFAGFRRRVVVIFPSADEWRRRLSQHQTSDGEQIPDTALLKLQVSCSLPEQQSDLQEELQYVELPLDQAQTLLQEYKDEARRLLPPIHKQEKKKRKRPHPHSAHRMQWTGCPGWSNMRLNMQMWRQRPRYWHAANEDQSCYYRDDSHEGYW